MIIPYGPASASICLSTVNSHLTFLEVEIFENMKSTRAVFQALLIALIFNGLLQLTNLFPSLPFNKILQDYISRTSRIYEATNSYYLQ